MQTLSIIKADTRGFVGHSSVHPEMIEEAERRVLETTGSLLIDGQATSCGDDLALVMSHRELLEPFASAHVVAGRRRGSHQPLMPVAQRHATPSRFDGPRWPDACDAAATS